MNRLPFSGGAFPYRNLEGCPPPPTGERRAKSVTRTSSLWVARFSSLPLWEGMKNELLLKRLRGRLLSIRRFWRNGEREKRKGKKANLPILNPSFPLLSKISSPLAPKEGLTRAKLVISSVTASYANQPTYFQIIIISSSFASASVGAFYFHALSWSTAWRRTVQVNVLTKI